MFFCNHIGPKQYEDYQHNILSVSTAAFTKYNYFGTAAENQQQDTSGIIPAKNSFATVFRRQKDGWTWQLADAAESDKAVLTLISESQVPTEKDMSVLAAKELNDLTAEQRDLAHQDLHGMIREESLPQEIDLDSQLIEMESELDCIPEKPAFHLAMEQCPSYVQDKELRSMFLRAENYHPGAAAIRMIQFFQGKLQLFGHDKLTRNITQQDLSSEDWNCIKSGWTRTLTESKSGRSVMIMFTQHRMTDNIETVVRALWLQCMAAALRGKDSQQRGLVILVYNVGPNSIVNRQLLFRASALLSQIPIRVSAFHYCYDQPAIRPLINVVRLFIGKAARARTCVHEGSHMECKYALLGYGISKEEFPITDSGSLLVDPYPVWFQNYCNTIGYLRSSHPTNNELSDMITSPLSIADYITCDIKDCQLLSEEKNDNNHNSFSLSEHITTMDIQDDDDNNNNNNDASTITTTPNETIITTTTTTTAADDDFVVVDEPGPLDVPLGRGSGARQHPGYKKFQALLDSRREEYEAAGKFKKTEIAETIVGLVQQSGGTFLKRTNNGCWVEIDDITARAKVSHAFRAKRTTAKRTSK